MRVTESKARVNSQDKRGEGISIRGRTCALAVFLLFCAHGVTPVGHDVRGQGPGDVGHKAQCLLATDSAPESHTAGEAFPSFPSPEVFQTGLGGVQPNSDPQEQALNHPAQKNSRIASPGGVALNLGTPCVSPSVRTSRRAAGEGTWHPATSIRLKGGKSPIAAGCPFSPCVLTQYAQKFEGRRTANGERFSHRKLMLASRGVPLGATVELRYYGNTVRVRSVDRGRLPMHRPGRPQFDLSREACRRLGAYQRKNGHEDRRAEYRVVER